MIYQMYLYICLIFFVFSVLRIETSCLDLEATRSRETKSLLRIKIKRDFIDLILSLVWPARVWKILKSGYETQKKENIIKLKKD
jgi:hypothetical protein